MHAGNLQQQAAAAGALQALTYCPGRTDISAGIAGEGGIAPLVAMVTTGPLPLRSAAAGALCNLALANPTNQVSKCFPTPFVRRLYSVTVMQSSMTLVSTSCMQYLQMLSNACNCMHIWKDLCSLLHTCMCVCV